MRFFKSGVAIVSSAVGIAFLVASDVPSAAAQSKMVAGRTEVTSNFRFENACVAFATGYVRNPGSGKLVPEFRKKIGKCGGGSKPLVFSITQENPQNNHSGSANYDADVVSYMADYDYAVDIGQWVKLNVLHGSSAPVITFALDTINFKKLNVTGWPLQFGHLFAALGDSSIDANLGNPIFVEFDIRIRADEVRSDRYTGYSGRRILLGALGDWEETPPRSNRAHFAEIDFVQSDGYAESYHELSRPGCMDMRYDRCFYDLAGRYSEGREVRFGPAFGTALPPPESGNWTHVRIPLSAFIKKLHWVSPPQSWSAARVIGLYIAIESEGATRTSIEIRNYDVSSCKPYSAQC
jgi:hypothetical protein